MNNRFDAATLPQVLAANPRESSWVLANAGSGKTRVLTNRVVRLLLAGTSPQKILCITFTNAAATNMLNRLGETLGSWAMLSNEELKENLLNLGEDEASLTPEKLDSARTLFARALETPGGMKIQTFHSFATALLRQFPLEADVSPQFKLIGDREARNIQIDLLNELVKTDRELIGELSRYLDYESLKTFTQDIFGKRDHFPDTVSKKAIWAKFDVQEDWGDKSFLHTITESDKELIKRLLSALAMGSETDQKKYKEIKHEFEAGSNVTFINLMVRYFLYGKSANQPNYPNKRFPTKAIREGLGPETIQQLESFAKRLSMAKISEENYQGARKTLLLHQLAVRILKSYKETKITNAWLDFDDLLTKVLAILSDRDISQWILYRLDEDIDHILVDEAQDVNSKQWKIVSILAEEFTSGAGQRGNLARTIFAVGDEKQSIFGFQGAAPEKFKERRDYFKQQFEKSGRQFIEEDLEFSFRSSDIILKLVDNFMELFPKLFYTRFIPHKPYKEKLPGRVELWPLVPKREPADDESWEAPIYSPQAKKPEEILAENLVHKIKDILKDDLVPTGNSGEARPVRPGDILILVQTRGPVYKAIIRELKKANLPLAGTDRINLSDDLAVRDLLALLQFMSVPKDDLSLAVILKSPLFGFDENDVFQLAYDRVGSLWDELVINKDLNERYRRAHDRLEDLLSLVGKETPYDLLEIILTVHNGRQLLISRLGEACTEALDILLDQALDYEYTKTPSLTGFLEWLEPDTVDIKRQFEQQRDEIRVMSIHGAKGLESPIVILPDTKDMRTPNDKIILSADEEEFPLWSTRPEFSKPVDEGLEVIKGENWKEYLRLLYVALTRAESRLIVCGLQRRSNMPTTIADIKNWYEMVHWVMTRNIPNLDFDFQDEMLDSMINTSGYLLMSENWPTKAHGPKEIDEKEDIVLPNWVKENPVEETPVRLSFSPSNLGGSKNLPAEEESETTRENALKKGRVIHHLLEHLPESPKSEWESRAEQLINLKFPEVTSENCLEWVANSIAILNNPALEFLFDSSKNTLEEVPITADIPELDHQSIYGVIDRLIIAEDHVLAIDFKTNRLVPARVEETPDGLLRQMGAYHRALEKIYPHKIIKTAILWTQTGELIELPGEVTLNALQSVITMSDTQAIN